MKPMQAEDFAVDKDWFSQDTATFGDRLAGAREIVGLSQKELAARLGVKHQTIVDWENDLNDPRANRLQMLSGVLNVSIAWLLTGEGEGLSSPSTFPGEAEEILAEMRRVRAQITDLTQSLGPLESRLRTALRG